MAFIEVIDYEASEGRLREIYDELIKSRGKLANVHTIQSLNPESIVKHMDLYLSIMFGKSPLRRVQREMIAVVVSAANKCEYCQLHHAEAVQHYWKDEEKVEMLKKDYTRLDLSEEDRLLCELAEQLTKDPSSIRDDQHIQPLKEAGLSDRAILDATLVIAYFNFVNRIVLGLGLEHSAEEIKGYSYE